MGPVEEEAENEPASVESVDEENQEPIEAD